ncbi:MBL fold metallo-hydrolase [Pseudomonas sp. NA-150]|uniref:MBL fold metallo-hydrolase n=1 Tax=Pseudomonas sp. NA-150 TaxID=3367525 RepID=UPI0037C69240
MSRRLSVVSPSPRKLDGGMMFGGTPRQIWREWIKPDENNLIDLASRGLLVQEEGLNVLVLAGCDGLLAPAPRTCRCQQHHKGLLDSLARLGLGENDIHAVVLTHLHAMLGAELIETLKDGDAPRLLFPNARYITSARQWSRARRPHPLDRELFVPQILWQLEDSGRMELLETPQCESLGSGWSFHVCDGFTPGQLLPEIAMPGGPVLFAGDLVPGVHWLKLDVTSGYDRNAECLIGEKERLLDDLVANRGRLFLTRDPEHALIKVMRDRQSCYRPYDHRASLNRLDC